MICKHFLCGLSSHSGDCALTHKFLILMRSILSIFLFLPLFLASYLETLMGSIQSAKTRLGTDCGSDHELLIAKFRVKLKKVEKTTRPFRYDLNQILYDYTVEVTNRFKRLDLIEWLMNYGWRFVTLQESGIKTIPRKVNAKKQNGCLRRPYK